MLEGWSVLLSSILNLESKLDHLASILVHPAFSHSGVFSPVIVKLYVSLDVLPQAFLSSLKLLLSCLVNATVLVAAAAAALNPAL